MNKRSVMAISVLLVFVVLMLLLRYWGGGGIVRFVPTVVLTSDLDSEKLLYDDVFMDEAIRTYTLRSLTASLSRLGYVRGVDCHNRAHEMGRRAYELFGGDSFKSCGIECHSGCRHGATEAFFADKGTSDLIGSMEVLCGDEMGNKFHMHQCIHGIGHGLMAWYDYELYNALEACDKIEHSFHQESCYSGVFMENIVGGIVRDGEIGGGQDVSHYTKYLSDDPHYPCNTVADRYKGMCYWLQTDRMLQLSGDVNTVGDTCAGAPEVFQFSCFYSMGRTVSGYFGRDPHKSFAVCASIAYGSDKYACLEGVLSDLIWDESQAGRAIVFCEMSLDSSFEKVCYDRLIVRASEVIPTVRMRQFCAGLPDNYYNQCMQQETPQAPNLSVKEDVKQVSRPLSKTGVVVIRYVGGKYVPDKVHVSVGQKVVWVNEDLSRSFWPASNIHPTHSAYPGSDIKKCIHDERMVIFDACESMGRGAEYSFVFNEVGSWRFHDHINPQATGTIIVSE